METETRVTRGVIVTLTEPKFEHYVWEIKLKNFDKSKRPKCVPLPDIGFTSGTLSRFPIAKFGGYLFCEELVLRVYLLLPKIKYVAGFTVELLPLRLQLKDNSMKELHSSRHELKRDGDDPRTNYHRYVAELKFGSTWEPKVTSLIVTWMFLIGRTTGSKLSLFTPVRPNPPISSGDLAEFYDSPSLSDVTLVCQDEEIRAHKMVLSMASTVFKKMFETDFKEKTEGRVLIEDMDKIVLRDMLKFMYNVQARPPSNFCEQIGLYKAAHYYNVDSLRRCATALLISIMDSENVLELYAIGELYKEFQIIKAAKEMMKRERRKVFKDEAARTNIIQRYPELLFEMFLDDHLTGDIYIE